MNYLVLGVPVTAQNARVSHTMMSIIIDVSLSAVGVLGVTRRASLRRIINWIGNHIPIQTLSNLEQSSERWRVSQS